MKKNPKYLIAAAIVIVIGIVIGVAAVMTNNNQEKLDSRITAHSWHRDGDDYETLYFTKDGDFGYYCACGNAVDDYDLCDAYTYNPRTKTIKLKCIGFDIVDELKIKEITDNKLVLDFEGEERTFTSGADEVETEE